MRERNFLSEGYCELPIDPFQLVGMQLNWRTEQWVAVCMIIDFIAAWRFSFVLSSSSEVLTSHLKGVFNNSPANPASGSLTIVLQFIVVVLIGFCSSATTNPMQEVQIPATCF